MASKYHTMIVMKDLPDETLACIASYLPLWDRVSLTSIQNPRWNRAVAEATRRIHLDPDEDGQDLNRALRFAAQHCNKLAHFSLEIPQSSFLREDDFGGQWFTLEGDKDSSSLALDGHSLAQAIERCSSTLKCVELIFAECCEEQVENLIREANYLQCITHCSSLEVLNSMFLKFSSMQQVVDVIRPLSQTLVVLKLDYLMPREAVASVWNDTHLLARAISEMIHLQRLSLQQQNFYDEDIATMVGPHSRELRSLCLSGQFGQSPGDNEHIPRPGFLTDQSMDIIGNFCTKLQNLDVSYNRRITQEGLKRVIKSCPLRELSAAACSLPMSMWKELTALSSTLLLVAWDLPEGQVVIDDYHADQLDKAIVASGGRTVFSEFINGLYAPQDKIGQEFFMKQWETIRIIDEVSERAIEAQEGRGTFNEWEDYL